MGCYPSKLKSNVLPQDDRQVIGSTQLQADQIVILGNSVFLPIDDQGESAIIEIEIDDKKMKVFRGYKNHLIRQGLS